MRMNSLWAIHLQAIGAILTGVGRIGSEVKRTIERRSRSRGVGLSRHLPSVSEPASADQERVVEFGG